MLETPDLRDLKAPRGITLEIQFARDVNDALRDTSIPASTRLKNAAVLYMQLLTDMSAGCIPVSTRSSTTWTELSSIIKQYANISDQVRYEIKNTFRTGNEAETVLHEATVDSTSKEAVRFSKKQSLICQVLIAGSDAQTMTGIRLNQSGVG